MAEPIIVSWSQINSYRTCHHKHQLEYRERWTRQPSLSSALGKGILFHKALEAYYGVLKVSSKLVGNALPSALAVLDTTPVESDFDIEAVETVRWMVEGYHEQYYGDTTWQVIDVERKFLVELPKIIEGQPNLWLKGSIDLVVRNEENRLIVLDHKTCSVMPKSGDSFELSDQFGLYLWALGQLGEAPWQAMHNAVKSKRNKGDIPGAIEEWQDKRDAGGRAGVQPRKQSLNERFSRRLITRTPRELDTLAREATASIAMAYMMPQFNERNPDESTCKYMCSFREACLEGRKLGPKWEREALAYQSFVQDYQRH